MPIVRRAVKGSTNVNDALGGQLLVGHKLVGLSVEQAVGHASIVERVDGATFLVHNRELHIDDGLDTETVLDLGRDVLLKLLLEDMGLDVQAVGRGLGETERKKWIETFGEI
jgi:hypothetical protein